MHVRTGQRGPDRPRSCLCLDLGGRAVRHDLAASDQHDPVGVGVSFLQVVSGEGHGLAAFGYRPHRLPEVAPALDIDAGCRLVEQQQVRVTDQGGCEPYPLSLATRQLRGPLPGELGRPGDPQDVVHGKRMRIIGRHNLDEFADP